MAVFDHTEFDNHESLHFINDEATGLRTIIAVHSTALGPAAGGCRRWSYASDSDALTDALRLSRGMTYKNAVAELPFGGGKAVILGSDTVPKTPELLAAFGRAVNSLGGQYVTAEDVGMSVEDMRHVQQQTKYVSGLPQSGEGAGGDPSPWTALGVFLGIEAAVKVRLDKDSLDGEIVAPAEILYANAEILAPCALGNILTSATIPQIKAKIIAGAANNQLSTLEDGARLSALDILYAPDYVINAGGIINVSHEYYGGSSDDKVRVDIEKIPARLQALFAEANETGRPTNELADESARRLIAAGKK